MKSSPKYRHLSNLQFFFAKSGQWNYNLLSLPAISSSFNKVIYSKSFKTTGLNNLTEKMLNK